MTLGLHESAYRSNISRLKNLFQIEKGNLSLRISFTDNPFTEFEEGYRLDKIRTDNQGEYEKMSDGTYSFTFELQDAKLTFVTVPIRYRVKYYGNGGKGGGKIDTVRYGEDYIIPNNWYTDRKGREFCGFNTEKDGSGKSFKEGQKVKNLTTVNGESVVLYAQWKEPAKSGKVSGSIFADGSIGIWIGLAAMVSLLAVMGVIAVRRKKQ